MSTSQEASSEEETPLASHDIDVTLTQDTEKDVIPFDEDDVEMGPLATRKELWGFYMYDFANSVFTNSLTTAFLPPFLTLMAKANMEADGRLHFLGLKILPSSYFTYWVSLSVALQLITFLVFGAVADYGTLRKKLFILTSAIGSIATCMFLLAVPEAHWLGGVLLCVSNVSLGTSVIFYNSFLPLIVKNHPLVVAEKDPDAKKAMYSKLDHEISSKGFMMGSVGGVTLLIINVVLFFVMPGECNPECKSCPGDCPSDCEESEWNTDMCDPNFWTYRFNLSLSGFWWLGFSLFSWAWIKPRISKPLPPGKHYVLESVRQVKRTLEKIPQLPNTFFLLGAFWLYSDGFSTLGTGASLVAIQELDYGALKLGLAILESNIAAFFGVKCWTWIHLKSVHGPWLQYKGKPIFTTKAVIATNIIITLMIPIYVRLPGTITTDFEFYFAAFVFGFQAGSMQSMSRVLLARLTPVGHEAEFFSFYELSDKGTSWLGPLIIGLVNDLTNDLRWAVITIVVLLVAALIPLYFVNEEKGKLDAANYELKKPQTELPEHDDP